ncbi:MAG: aminopeptidase [Phycisphaerae bacterium]|jgi:aminopeptidase|nr:MAG: aminopeptidase [Phycisphaerae bacterium]
MKDPRFTELARLLVRHSIRVNPGEKVLIEAFDIPTDFVVEMIRQIEQAGGMPLVSTYSPPILRALLQSASEEQMRFIGQIELQRMQGVQGYIGVRGSSNISEMSDVPTEKMQLYERLWLKPVHSEQRVKKTKWVVLRWPTPSMAQSAGMSTEAFEDFYFRVCAGVDYAKMAQAMKPLVDLMNRTDRVRIKGPGTDLSFSIKGIGAIPCVGERNIPDGECFSCPVKTSVEGTIRFSTETLYQGTVFSGIELSFEKGRIVSARASSEPQTQKLNEILDADEGARYIGEFSLGFNPHITRPMRDILFDEKIAGSFHFTPGQAYEQADNGNRSQIHWDMVNIQTPEFGGGEIWFDDQLIRKDGLFVTPELEGLNPDQLGQ